MADEDRGNEGPSLELPSLGFGRRRNKKKRPTEPAQPPEVAEEPAAPPEPVAAPEPAAPPEPVAAPEPVAPPQPVPAPEPEPQADARPQPEPEPAPPAQASPAPAATQPLFADEVEEAPTRTAPAAPAAVPSFVPTPVQPLSDEESDEESVPPAKPKKPRRQRKPRREVSSIGGLVAAVVTGLLVGIITVGLTWLALRLCEVVKGTSSCGQPGFLLLVAILIAAVLLGSVLLRTFGVSDPTSTSFLAVGLLTVLALLFLVNALFDWWMIIVIPLFSVATYALSYWVTATFIEPAER